MLITSVESVFKQRPSFAPSPRTRRRARLGHCETPRVPHSQGIRRSATCALAAGGAVVGGAARAHTADFNHRELNIKTKRDHPADTTRNLEGTAGKR